MYYFKQELNVRILVVMTLIALIIITDLLFHAGYQYTDYQFYFLALANLGQKLLIWHIPLFLCVLGIESTIQEITNKSHYILISRMGKFRYLMLNLKKNILISLIPFVIGLSINFIVNKIIYTSKLSQETSNIIDASNKYLNFQFSHPYLMILIVTIIFLGIISLVTIQSTLFAYIFEDRKIVYASSFAMYYFFIASKYEITGILQPFDEYGFMRDFIPFILFVFCYLVVIFVSWFIVRKKYDEIF